jgi:hypothetical protein
MNASCSNSSSYASGNGTVTYLLQPKPPQKSRWPLIAGIICCIIIIIIIVLGLGLGIGLKNSGVSIKAEIDPLV